MTKMISELPRSIENGKNIQGKKDSLIRFFFFLSLLYIAHESPESYSFIREKEKRRERKEKNKRGLYQAACGGSLETNSWSRGWCDCNLTHGLFIVFLESETQR